MFFHQDTKCRPPGAWHESPWWPAFHLQRAPQSSSVIRVRQRRTEGLRALSHPHQPLDETSQTIAWNCWPGVFCGYRGSCRSDRVFYSDSLPRGACFTQWSLVAYSSETIHVPGSIYSPSLSKNTSVPGLAGTSKGFACRIPLKVQITHGHRVESNN